MRSKKRVRKELDGLETVDADTLRISQNALIQGNLTVNGSINGGGGGGPATETYFVATDSVNQYRTNAATMDLKTNGENPVFRFRNSADATNQSTLEAGTLSAVSANLTNVSATNATLGTVQSTTHTVSGSVTSGSVTTGPIQATVGVYSSGLSSSGLNTGAINATSATVTGTTSTLTMSATNVNTTNATIGTTNTTNLVTGTTTSTGILSSTNTTDANVATNGAIFTEGGIKSLRTIVANQGVQIPYGQPLKSDNTHTIQTKMMDAAFNKSGGLVNDALYLYAPGSTAGSASPDYVLGANAQAVKLPQTTQATSTTTGALQVAGGVGVEGNLHVGGTITGGSVSYSTTSSGTFQVTNGTGTTFQVASTHQSNNPSSGSATFAGGVGIQGNLNVGGTITGGSVSYSSTSSGTFDVTNGVGTTFTVDSTEESVSTTTGAATVAGGVGVGKNLNVGGDVLLGRTSLDGTRYVAIYNASVANNAATSLVFDDAATNSAEILKLGPNHTSGPNDFIIRNPTGNMLLYGSGNAGFYVGAANTFSQLPFNVQSAQDATTLFDGAITTAGGLSVFKTSRLGGDLVVGQGTAWNGPRIFSLSNTSTGNDAFPIMVFDTASPAKAVMFMNGPNRTPDGGPNTMTIRNDAGTLRLQSTGAVGINVSTASTNVQNPLVVESIVNSSSPTTGAVRVAGGVGVQGNLFVGGTLNAGTLTPSSISTPGTITAGNEISVERTGAAQIRMYNNGQVTEWLVGQRDVSDHNLKFVSKVGPTQTELMELNTAGQLRLGNGAFFGYSEGTFNPQPFRVNGGIGAFFITSQQSRFVRVGKQVSCYLDVSFDITSGSGIIGVINTEPIASTLELSSILLNNSRCELPGFAKPYYLTEGLNDNLVYVTGFNGNTWNPGNTNGCRLVGSYVYLIN